MEIIAVTGKGFLLEATKQELDQLLKSTGILKPDDIKEKTGMKISVDNVSGAIHSIRSIKDSYDFKYLKEKANEIVSTVEKFEQAATALESKGVDPK